MAKTSSRKSTKQVNLADIKVSVVTAQRQGKTATQVRWLGDARPTADDTKALKDAGFGFYADKDGPCWGSFKVPLEDAKALVIQRGYDIPEGNVVIKTTKASTAKQSKTTTKKTTAKQSGLEKLMALDADKLEKLLKIAELLG